MEFASLKLMLQPLVENAIYHGMEFMDGDGKIGVTVRREGEDLRFEVSDNGLGMTKRPGGQPSGREAPRVLKAGLRHRGQECK